MRDGCPIWVFNDYTAYFQARASRRRVDGCCRGKAQIIQLPVLSAAIQAIMPDIADPQAGLKRSYEAGDTQRRSSARPEVDHSLCVSAIMSPAVLRRGAAEGSML